MDGSQTMMYKILQLLKDICNDSIEVHFQKAGKINPHISHKHLTGKIIHILFTRMLTSGVRIGMGMRVIV